MRLLSLAISGFKLVTLSVIWEKFESRAAKSITAPPSVADAALNAFKPAELAGLAVGVEITEMLILIPFATSGC
jgi:hypothetical protein